MSTFRAVLVAFVALSVAMLPVAGAEFRAFSPDSSFDAAQSDCCPQGQQCDKQAKGECGKLAGCTLKCSSFSASLAALSGVARLPSASQRMALVAQSAIASSQNPPLPPPRV
jgi:hypothetical protein